MIYELYREQQLYCSLDEAWDFFASPNNLPIIAPQEMDFTVLTEVSNGIIYNGMQIDYRLKPLFGIPIRWKSEVRLLENKKCFVDYQLEGPYKMWHHYHEFKKNEEGVLMKDLLKYEMKYGFFGEIFNHLIVRNKLEYIFNNRRTVIEELFDQKISVNQDLSIVNL